MLRGSAKSIGEPVDAAAAVEGAAGTVPYAAELVGFVDAVATGADADAPRRDLARAAGQAAVVEAAAVLANFEMMTRVADGTGAATPAGIVSRLAGERARLGLDAFRTAR
jgi:hypothetical protein